MAKQARWRVTVREPRADKKEKNLVLVARPPKGLVDEWGKRVRKKEKSSGTQDGKVAEARAREAEERLNATLPSSSFDRTVEEAVAAYLTGHEVAETYRVSCRSALKHARHTLGKLRGAELTKGSLLRAQDDLRRRLGPATVNLYLSVFGAAWRWCYDRELVEHPWPGVRALPTETKKRPYQPEEVQRVLDWLAAYKKSLTDWHSFFSLLADTGCRPGEIAELRGRTSTSNAAAFEFGYGRAAEADRVAECSGSRLHLRRLPYCRGACRTYGSGPGAEEAGPSTSTQPFAHSRKRSAPSGSPTRESSTCTPSGATGSPRPMRPVSP